jgi:hypothetical protein
MTRPTPEYAQALHWHGQYQQALQRAEMLAADLRVLEQALAAANRRLATATQTLAEHGLPVPPPIRSES